jgi:hypothetical protein
MGKDEQARRIVTLEGQVNSLISSNENLRLDLMNQRETVERCHQIIQLMAADAVTDRKMIHALYDRMHHPAPLPDVTSEEEVKADG